MWSCQPITGLPESTWAGSLTKWCRRMGRGGVGRPRDPKRGGTSGDCRWGRDFSRKSAYGSCGAALGWRCPVVLWPPHRRRRFGSRSVTGHQGRGRGGRSCRAGYRQPQPMGLLSPPHPPALVASPWPGPSLVCVSHLKRTLLRLTAPI